LNVLESHLLDDVVFRVEQSRFESNFQAEEFRHLNTNFQTYLTDIKQIDDENSQLQNNIEQIRTAYIRTLENHLKRLPEDFRQESHVLTEAHLERYKSKSRAKRFFNEREEMKKRINFVGNNEKEQLKRLNHLQRQERTVQNEMKSLHDQYRNAVSHVEREKRVHQQAMKKIDQLQVQLEQVSIERSKTEVRNAIKRKRMSAYLPLVRSPKSPRGSKVNANRKGIP
jgi:chromosome segregation ATPase